MSRWAWRGVSVVPVVAAQVAVVFLLLVSPAKPALSGSQTETGLASASLLRHWSACEPITVEVVPSPVNAGYAEEVELAVRDVASRLGLTVQFTTGSQAPSPEWVAAASEETGDRLLRVAVAEHGPLLTRGLNGEARVQVTGGGEIVRGSIVLSHDALTWMVAGPGVINPGSRLRLLVMHEVGHAFGLPHSPDLNDVMSSPAVSYTGPADAWGPGDVQQFETRRLAAECLR